MRTLETSRLILRNIEFSDSNDIFELLSDEQTCLDDGDYPAETDIHSDSFLTSITFLSSSNEHYGIVLKEIDKLIGLIHLMKCDEKNALEIGFVMNKQFRRNGYTKEAILEVIDECAKNKGVKKIIMSAYDYNDASIATMKSLGLMDTNIKKVNHSQKGWIHSVLYMKEYEKTN